MRPGFHGGLHPRAGAPSRTAQACRGGGAVGRWTRVRLTKKARPLPESAPPTTREERYPPQGTLSSAGVSGSQTRRRSEPPVLGAAAAPDTPSPLPRGPAFPPGVRSPRPPPRSSRLPRARGRVGTDSQRLSACLATELDRGDADREIFKGQQNATRRISGTKEPAGAGFRRRNFFREPLVRLQRSLCGSPRSSRQEEARVEAECANSVTLALLCHGGLPASHQRGGTSGPRPTSQRAPATGHSAGEGVGPAHQATLTPTPPPGWGLGREISPPQTPAAVGAGGAYV